MLNSTLNVKKCGTERGVSQYQLQLAALLYFVAQPPPLGCASSMTLRRRCREPDFIQLLPNLRCDGALHDRRPRGAHCYPCRRIR